MRMRFLSGTTAVLAGLLLMGFSGGSDVGPQANALTVITSDQMAQLSGGDACECKDDGACSLVDDCYQCPGLPPDGNNDTCYNDYQDVAGYDCDGDDVVASCNLGDEILCRILENYSEENCTGNLIASVNFYQPETCSCG